MKKGKHLANRCQDLFRQVIKDYPGLSAIHVRKQSDGSLSVSIVVLNKGKKTRLSFVVV